MKNMYMYVYTNMKIKTKTFCERLQMLLNNM